MAILYDGPGSVVSFECGTRLVTQTLYSQERVTDCGLNKVKFGLSISQALVSDMLDNRSKDRQND